MQEFMTDAQGIDLILVMQRSAATALLCIAALLTAYTHSSRASRAGGVCRRNWILARGIIRIRILMLRTIESAHQFGGLPSLARSWSMSRAGSCSICQKINAEPMVIKPITTSAS